MKNFIYRHSFLSSPANVKNAIEKKRFTKKMLSGILGFEKNVSVKNFNIECSNKSLITAQRFEIKNTNTNEETPLIIYFYGNSWNTQIDTYYSNFCSHLCNITKSVILKIDTSPAPLNKFPNAATECLDAIKWTWQACSFWRINREKIYIFAEGCGANNALNALIHLRDEKDETRIAGTILIDPLLDCRLSQKSCNENAITPTITKYDIKRYIDEYVNDQTEIFDKNLTLVLQKDWTRLSTIMLISAKKSPIYDDSVFLYHRVSESEGKIIFYPIDNALSGFLYTKNYPEKKRVENMISMFIANNDPEYINLVFG